MCIRDSILCECAQNVANYLMGQGLQRERFEVAGFGYTHPVADNSTEQGRALNRRVEIRIVPLQG
jgi:outer membrane protein OmpA-like peptidoglycan-associated protein